MLRRLRFGLAATPLVLALLYPLPVLANTAVAIDCGDGSPISGSVDLTTLTELQGSVQAMLDNPSGMSCSLSQLSLVDPLASTNDPGSFVVGGGRYGREAPNCPINFSLSAHVGSSGIAHGTQTATENNTTNGTPPCPGQGHIKANVTCVAVNGNLAEVRGDITDATGSLGPPFFAVGQVWVTDVQDNGRPSTGIPDDILQFSDNPGTENGCVAGITFPPPFTVDNGNITVHNG
jgi:hypothetical protein